MSENKRSLDTVRDDTLYPGRDEIPPQIQGLRYEAIADVLMKMPDEDYEKLRDRYVAKEFTWFLPRNRAEVYRVPLEPSAMGIQPVTIIYLARVLDKTEWKIVVAIVAHELAHFLLGDLHAKPREEDRKMSWGGGDRVENLEFSRKLEDEAWGRVRQWGYEEEEKAWRAEQEGQQAAEEEDNLS